MAAITLDKIVKIIKVAEDIAGSPLFALIKDKLPKIGIDLSDDQKAQLDVHYAELVRAEQESRESEQTGRHRDPGDETPTEGDPD